MAAGFLASSTTVMVRPEGVVVFLPAVGSVAAGLLAGLLAGLSSAASAVIPIEIAVAAQMIHFFEVMLVPFANQRWGNDIRRCAGAQRTNSGGAAEGSYLVTGVLRALR